MPQVSLFSVLFVEDAMEDRLSVMILAKESWTGVEASPAFRSPKEYSKTE